MGKVIRKRKSLKWDFVKYFLICAVFILIGSGLIIGLANAFLSENINGINGYQIYLGGEKKLYVQESKTYIKENETDQDIMHPERYFLTFNTKDLFQFIAVPLWSFLCVAVCGTIFYRRKLEKPIDILSAASENISNNRLDFSVEVPEQNELGELCLSFEKMRATLNNNYHEMWRQVEERKRLNAAFAHDLRTPLTVLKGQSEMLAKYAPKMSEEKITATAKVMERHIARLENYVNKMNDLQRLEDIEIRKQAVNGKDFIKQMGETGASLCKSKEFVFRDKTPDRRNMKIDVSVVMEVYENLLANAIRFAKNKVTVTIDLQDDVFSMTVEDDGAGFTARDLSEATTPFYKSDSEKNTEHFGMGLNICNILCEKHGGYLELSNAGGAKAKAAFRQSYHEI